MSNITIQCRLVAPEPARQYLWELMAHKNTPLINELLKQVAQHPDFETWRQKAQLKAGIVKQLCEPLKQDPRFVSQPGRFYTSAIALVEYIYKSWFKVQERLQRKLEGQNRWLVMLKSDEELVQISQSTLDDIRAKATELLSSVTSENPTPHPEKRKKSKSTQPPKTNQNLSQKLFEMYEQTLDNLTHCAIRYLLKNGCKIPNQPEDPEKFAQRRRKVELKIERLTEQLESRLPKGRDLTGNTWFETLALAPTIAPQNAAEVKSWQDKLLTMGKSIPFPINYETNEDLTWSKNQKGRLCVQFNGLGKHTFEIYCDQRQLKWFERFYQDQEIKRESKNPDVYIFRKRRFIQSPKRFSKRS